MRAEEPPPQRDAVDLDAVDPDADPDADPAVGGLDVVDHGLDRPRRRVRWSVWARVLVPLLLAAAVVGYVLDDRARQQEYDALVERVALAEEAVDLAESRVVSIKQYVSPTLFNPDVSETLRRDLARLVRGTAEESGLELAAERERVRAIDVLPWHRAQEAARDALVAYLDERKGRLDTVLADTSSATPYPARDRLDAALAAAAADAGRPLPVAAQRPATKPDS